MSHDTKSQEGQMTEGHRLDLTFKNKSVKTLFDDEEITNNNNDRNNNTSCGIDCCVVYK